MVPQVISHYRVIKRLGSGGMCEVYLAEDTILKRKVALKILSKKKVSGRDAQRRFVKEAEATAQLDHPNICSIYEVGIHSGLCFMAIQYIEGQTLAGKMQSEQPGIEEIINIAAQAAEALAAAHAKGIIHRDIKPQNIMVTPEGRVKVLDFGLAKVIHDRQLARSQAQTSVLTQQGVIVGTVPYFSPEQARGEMIDHRSDIFSLGVVIYELLSGTHPFKSRGEAVTLSLILTQDPPPLTRFLSNVPEELQRIVSKALCKEKEMRYQAARELHIDLVRLKAQIGSSEKIPGSHPPRSDDAAADNLERFVANRAEVPTFSSEQKTRTKRPVLTPYSFHRSRIFRLFLLAGLLISIALAVGMPYFWVGKSNNSVAVLPFVFIGTDGNNPNDPEAEYLIDGLTESVINSLSQFSSLKVIARTSVFRYKGKEIDPQQVGKELGVRNVVMGRVVRRGDNIVIKAELSDIQENRQIWGNEYESKRSELLAMQREITRDIIDNLSLKENGDERSRLNKSYTNNEEAYDLYLRGRYYWNKRTEDGFRKAIVFFQKAVEKDPSYAQAYSGLADTYMLLSDWGFLTPSDGYSRARDAVVRALSIDDRLAETHTSLAGIKAVLDWDWAGAEKEYRRAIALNHNYATAHHWYATHLMVMGRADESLAEIKLAQSLDPLSIGINKDFAMALLYARRYDEAIVQCRKTMEIDPTFLQMYPDIAHAYQGKRMYDEAVKQMQYAHGLSPNDPQISYGLAEAYALAGMRAEAEKILNELEQEQKPTQFLPKEMALLHALLGNKDKAFEILQKAVENHYFVVSELKIDTRFDVLRSDARYSNLLRSIGLE